MQGNGVVLPALGIGAPLQRDGQPCFGTEIEDVAKVVPDFGTAQLNGRGRLLRPVQETYVDVSVRIGSQAADESLIFAGVVGEQLVGAQRALGRPGRKASKLLFVLRDGIAVFGAVGGVDGQIVEDERVLHRDRSVRCRSGCVDRVSDILGIPDERPNRFRRGGLVICRGVRAAQDHSDGRVLYGVLGNRQILDDGQLRRSRLVVTVGECLAGRQEVENIAGGVLRFRFGAGPVDRFRQGVGVQAALVVEPGQGGFIRGKRFRIVVRGGLVHSGVSELEQIVPVLIQRDPVAALNGHGRHALRFIGSHGAAQGECDGRKVDQGIAVGQICPELFSGVGDGVVDGVHERVPGFQRIVLGCGIVADVFQPVLIRGIERPALRRGEHAVSDRGSVRRVTDAPVIEITGGDRRVHHREIVDLVAEFVVFGQTLDGAFPEIAL